MIIEKIVFGILSIALFTIIFLKMISKNNATYVYVLAIQFIGMIINFLELFFNIKLNIIIRLLSYILAIIIPIVIILIERIKNISFPELFNYIVANLYLKRNDIDTAKQYALKIIENNPRSYSGHKLMAKIYEREENIELAIDEYIKVIEINAKDYDSTYVLSELLNKDGRKNESTTILEDLLRSTPDNYKATDLLANIYIEE